MSLHFTRGIDSRLTMSTARRMPDDMLRLYEHSFPDEERRDVADLQARIAEGSINLLLLQIDGSSVGFITLHALPSGVSYIEHFAVDEAMRGNGAGSAALRLLMAMRPEPLVLEVEPEGSNPFASRRIAFYRRAGFMLWSDYPYIQPPYSDGLDEVELRLMTHGSAGEADIHALATEIRSVVYGAGEQSI